VVSLSAEASGADPRRFRIAGSYEPVPDPGRLGDPSHEARLHLPDLISLTRDPADPAAAETVGALNVRLADPADTDAFARDLAARMPGLVVHPTFPRKQATDPFVVL